MRGIGADLRMPAGHYFLSWRALFGRQSQKLYYVKTCAGYLRMIMGERSTSLGMS